MTIACVYLGALYGKDEKFCEAVITLGKELVVNDITLIYGGSSLGMMGLLAKTVKSEGGKVIGVITKYLVAKENPLDILDELHLVDSMQE